MGNKETGAEFKAKITKITEHWKDDEKAEGGKKKYRMIDVVLDGGEKRGISAWDNSIQLSEGLSYLFKCKIAKRGEKTYYNLESAKFVEFKPEGPTPAVPQSPAAGNPTVGEGSESVEDPHAKSLREAMQIVATQLKTDVESVAQEIKNGGEAIQGLVSTVYIQKMKKCSKCGSNVW